VVREPLGALVSVISAVELPADPVVARLRRRALRSARVVLKPPRRRRSRAAWLSPKCSRRPVIPKGVFNVVNLPRRQRRSVGEELISNPLVRGISFTGSTAVGQQVAAKAGGFLKKCCVELRRARTRCPCSTTPISSTR